MLEELEIRNLGPIDHALLELRAGMTVITGETGAGKSMLLDAVRLISGGPTQISAITPGADDTWAQGIFRIGSNGDGDGKRQGEGSPAGDGVHGALAAAREVGVEPEDGELFLARSVPRNGRSRSMLNGRSVPRSVLRSISDGLVTIHGQADQMRIAAPARQREFLDTYAGDDDELTAYAQALAKLRAADDHLERLQRQQADALQRADYLRDAIATIDRVDPHSGELEDLKTRRERIENAAVIAEGVGGAVAAIDPTQMEGAGEETPGAVELIDPSIQSLRGMNLAGVYASSADRLESVNAELSDILFTLNGQLGEGVDPQDLDVLNGRIHELSELTQRWGPTVDDVLKWRERAALELEDLDASPEKVAALHQERDALYRRALKAADRLSAHRSAAARRLSRQVTGELSSLAMGCARLDIEVRARTGGQPLDASGRDDVAFLFTPFPGSPALPMGKSASGGELSRLMLALELAAADPSASTPSVPSTSVSSTSQSSQPSRLKSQDPHESPAAYGPLPMTFIFDEVDAGVGGKSAVELGRRLARLARVAQVIVVTHLPQVASWAQRQFVVAKGEVSAGAGRGTVRTTVRQVHGEDRIHELARMLSGSESATSLQHARELLKTSRL